MTRILLNFGLCLALCGALALGAYGGCSEKTARSAVQGQCDAYLECVNGAMEERLCPDGLLFNEKSAGYPCGYPNEVSCEQRTKLQSAQPTDECPHQFGYYRMGDKSHCGQFMSCVSGKAFVVDCPEGLAFNPENYQCDWPDLVADCDAEAFLGFKCPQIQKSSQLGDEEYRFYPVSDDCSKYFSCINGSPRLNHCPEGYGFNPEINACDGLENITCSGSVRNAVRPQPIQQKPQRQPSANNYSQQSNRYQQPAKLQAPRSGGFSNSFQQPRKPGAYSAFQQQNSGRPNYGRK